MSQENLVSVIIPSYNYGAFIAETVTSLQSQNYKCWEAIVVDDGSVDDTASRVAALARKDARISYIYQQNQGVSAARNAGMERARGEFVVFLDADDLFSPGKLQAHIEHFRRCPSVDISYSKFRYFSDTNRGSLFTNYQLDSVREPRQLVSGFGQKTFPALIRKNRLPLPTVMFRNALLQRVGHFELGMKALEDWDFLLRCILRGACVAGLKDKSAMVLVRVHSGSATRNIAFVDYMDRIYGNVRSEIARLRALGDEDAAIFYDRALNSTLTDLERRRVRKNRKVRQKEIMECVRRAGIFDTPELFRVLEKYRLDFFGAYLRVVIGELIAIFKFKN